MYTITLADGTRLEPLELNGNNYIADRVIGDSVFNGNLGTVTISDGENTETHRNMVLIQNKDMDGASWFILEDSAEQQKEDAIRASGDIKTYKAHRIAQSKAALSAFLEENPVSSTAHGGKAALYSATAEKQALLTSTLVMAQGAAQAGVPYDLTWNATGEECETWTAEELQQLAFELAAYVKPLVAKQQEIEVALNACKTLEAVDAIVFDFASVHGVG